MSETLSTQSLTKTEHDPGRIAFTIPEFDRFGEILHDRLHGLVYYMENIEGKFMLITNYFDRDELRIDQKKQAGEKDLEGLIYGGTLTQRQLLEKDEPIHYINSLSEAEWDVTQKEKWKQARDRNWAKLNRQIMLRDMKDVETFGFFEDFRQGVLSFESVKPGKLKDYFREFNNIFRENEYPILNDYFNLKQDRYIGIPLLGVGLFQGIVWIIFENSQTRKISNPDTIRRLIKTFQLNYDNLLLDWDTTGVNIKRQSVIDAAIDRIEVTNPIQIACDVKKYYEIQKNFLDEKIKRSNDVVDEVLKSLNRMAIITILLDSFAHNISAHSLTALSWWFRERAEYLENPDEEERQRMEQLGQDKNPLILLSKLFPQKTLSRELYPLFKFLLEKGAFWSGITRQTNFTGKSSSLFNILWYDFINNPLYLGTIANTEEVSKLHINLTIYTNETPTAGSPFLNTKTIKTNAENIPLDGTFASIDLADFAENQRQNNNAASIDKNQPIESIFIKKNDLLFGSFKQELEKLRAFFPGGVVGKHAFFTLLENEIRNVKHFKDEVLKDIQKNGLVLNISIHERPIDSTLVSQAEDQLFKIGVWLKHPVALTADLLLRRIEGLEKDIVTVDTGQPQLGGNYQDKICATMLLTSSFDLVQDNSSPLGRIYYPWIKTAGSNVQGNQATQIQEFEVSYRKYRGIDQDEFNRRFASEQGMGYLKKYFHLWKGADIMALDGKQALQMDLENLARFRFLVLPPASTQLRIQYEAEGIIRILESEKIPTNIAEAYQQWLPQWLKSVRGTQNIAFTFWYGQTKIGRVIFLDGECRYQNYQQLRHFQSSDPLFPAIQNIPQQIELHTEHGGKSSMSKPLLSYRSHGELMSHFYGGKTIQSVETLAENDLGELIEVLTTRICIFDRRTYNRLYPEDSQSQVDKEIKIGEQTNIKAIQRERLELFRQQLFLDFRNEGQVDFEEIKKRGFQYFHFLVLHLSFIEGMLDGRENDSKYSEERIIEFIDEQILQGESPDTVGNDFCVVITTGRGRTLWWEKIKANPAYARFVTFRPIESILGVVEDAQQIHDDFDMKHNMVKLLFGS
ncbi:hypothetical protein [Haliscomenobacter hydrossis]|uniref:Uncharacterized protein n=1 Tax=Haliscomenobacter hydrossis (strain ATCC 27775 / DSM 1100 / LMG 10767 / O) TaxID=760192 RepID=F4L613_HALH1|nr:hypothetical protein [Haliscomenobacter hydrossis]AEE53073.1 hypothetical protein Halhy_5247 [Haliscomenobacter hydrossis DSM 1100]